MAHFAELDQNNKVINVIRISDELIFDENGVESEEIGIQYLKSHHGQDKTWIKTSINHNIRGHSAVIDGYYFADKDVFTSRKPHSSWILKEDNYTWKAPVEMPTDAPENYFYEWNESIVNWELKEIPAPPPKVIASNTFRSQLTLTEKLLWDNPDTADTPSKKAVLTTFIAELPLTVGEDNTTELLNLLVSEGVFTQQRLDEIISNL